jgi:ribonuclease Z
MKITFLGTSHGAPEVGRYCTSLLIEHNGYHYILDLGAPVEYLLKQRGLSIDTVKGIFVTHMHADHVEAISSVTKDFTTYHKNAEADLFLPEEEAIEPYKMWIKALHGRVPDRLRINVTKPGIIFDKYGLKVSAIRTEHISPDIPSYSYIFEADGKKVLFTGDLAYDYHDYPQIVKEEEFNLVVSELVHLSVEESQHILKGTKTKQMIFSHISLRNVDKLAELGITFNFPYIVAADGFEYSVI